ncbi:MAG TPA: DUF3160 domain-containing protein, partial [Fibrobacteria bacterium]|nr:DUF3160 domain-containing protein [Fibrobacteria bacterium]
PAWLEINGLLEYLVGQSDGLTAKGMGTVAHSLGIRSVPDYVKDFPEARFDSALAASGLGMQAILSQAKMYAPGQGDLDLSPIFSFMPQRFILDSYTFSQVVHPVTGMRPMPSALDIAFVLGDNSALVDMDAALTGNAPGALAAQRGLYGALGPGAWRSNLYMSWLDFLRQLNPKDNSAFAPAFRTAAWNRKMRNTQLASWAQLRRNTILYAKQSYTGGVTCEFPKAYVEPYPEFFAAVEAYAALGRKVLKDQPRMVDYFASLEATARRLADAAARTAQGLPPTEEQMAWLKTALSSRLMPAGCGSARVYDGWYRGLIYGPLPTEAERGKDFTIADVHTKPYTDELGPAQVLHVASGPVQMMAVAVKLDTCVSLFVGPVSSYHDVPRLGVTRMNDEEWTREVDTRGTLAKRPPWTASFLAP